MASGSDVSSVKTLAELNGVAPIPPCSHTLTDHEGRDDMADELSAFIPVIDFSLLSSPDRHIHAAAARQLGHACQHWGFFMIINHGISENLIQDVLSKPIEFHNLPLEEKKKCSSNSNGDLRLLLTIKYGTSAISRGTGENVRYWIDNLKAFNFPDQFNFPQTPPGFKELALEYSNAIRGVSRTLLQGISESLGLKPDAIIEYAGSDNGYQKLQLNLYPPCPEPDLVLGLPPHTDNGFLNFLLQTGIRGLQLKHNGKWVNANPLPNSLMVNTGDQLEVVSNGRYKSVWHRAVVNEKETRVSVVAVNGPEVDKEMGSCAMAIAEGEALVQEHHVQGLLSTST
ncbi:2-oxoglutarate-dependent dioxygenase 19-like [Prosopis cineraria]|uniref:2-oxoglutarate-dependent dioxygenase 19-like n=1 Tax=Prosopis cineraria TaxID=364024 RepID=UPI00240F63B1|nr:2-oxoglutarate-dependent dioxygenase 19-like [Prosopis cineraria]